MVAYAKQEIQQLPRLTPQEYLERERKAEKKSEYDDGVIVAMSGASWEHNLITSNVLRELGNQLRGKPCAVVGQDMRVRVPECNRYYYPDIVVVCGKPLFEDGELDTLLNPTLIIEVLSDSTETRDRGGKWLCYQTLDALTTYVLVAQAEPLIEIYRLQESTWTYSKVKGSEEDLSLDAIGCELRLADVYERVEFPLPADAQDNAEPKSAQE